MCESLRLYPPVPFEHTVSVDSDTLPSGHQIGKNTRVIYSPYSMGRMEEIWGGDCLEFKPERWISNKGELGDVSPYKFTAFNAGSESLYRQGIGHGGDESCWRRCDMEL
ncbi:CYTOCHROME P450 [Salix viminalis]|uniref:CYTOCHROME P450 n=1 Tax=Salix viminalis TaxID=40686 RepID=A0A9Q0NVB4_SALVM|nr:CYTOCHROME P450 [Salix viminalis]